MSAIEDSLRRALANGDARDPAFRESIYAASERALERTITARALDADASDEQRFKLADAIARVEADFPTPAPAEASPIEEPELPAEPQSVRPPSTHVPPPTAEDPPITDAQAAGDWRPAMAGPARRAKPRRGLLLAGLALVLFVGILLYMASVIFEPVETQAPSSSQAPSPTAESVAELPAEVGPADPPGLNWISVFSGDELDALTAPAGGRVEAVQVEGQPIVRMSGSAGAPVDPAATEGTLPEIALAIGPGLVGELAGSEVRVEIRAGSPNGGLREFAVRCEFAGQNVCERQRFATMMGEEAFVFDIAVPANAQTPAFLAIAPGVGGEGGDLDLYAVRMRAL